MAPLSMLGEVMWCPARLCTSAAPVTRRVTSHSGGGGLLHPACTPPPPSCPHTVQGPLHSLASNTTLSYLCSGSWARSAGQGSGCATARGSGSCACQGCTHEDMMGAWLPLSTLQHLRLTVHPSSRSHFRLPTYAVAPGVCALEKWACVSHGRGGAAHRAAHPSLQRPRAMQGTAPSINCPH